MRKRLLLIALSIVGCLNSYSQLVLQSYPFGHYWDISIGSAPDSYGNVYVAGELYNGGRTSTGFDLVRKLDSNGNIEWASGQVLGNSAFALKITSDQWGNCYLLGTFKEIFQLPGGPILSTPPDESAWFLVKYDPSGAVLWIQKIENTLSFGYHDLACDPFGNVYVSAYNAVASGNILPINFGPNLTVNARSFVVMYSSTGMPIWATGIGGGIVKSISVDLTGNVAIGGDLIGPFSIGNINYPLNVGGTFLALLNSNGEPSWAIRVTNNGSLVAVATDSWGNLIVTGEYAILSSMFAAKYSPSGSQNWLRTWGNPSSNWESVNVKDVITDSNGNCIFTGDFGENFTVQGHTFLVSGPNPITFPDYDAYLLCLDQTGNILWGQQAGDQSPFNSRERATHLAIDVNNLLYFTGYLPWGEGPYYRSMLAGNYYSLEIGSFLYVIHTSDVNGISSLPKDDLMVCPNPNKGVFTVRLIGAQEGNIKAELRNVLGQVVWQQALPVAQGEVNHQVQTYGLSKGMYYLQVNSGKGVRVQKVVVE